MAISTNGTVLARVAGALYNTQMSNATYSEVKTLDPATLADALYARDFSSATDLAVATTLVTNLGLASVTGLDNWVAAQLTAAGSAKGAKVVDLLNSFAQMTADTTYGAYATAFNTKVDAALALSQTTDNKGGTFAAAGTVTVANATFALTAGTDVWTGGAGDDTISATVATLGALDVIDGGAGNDTLNIVDTAAVASLGSATFSGIETVKITSGGAVGAIAAAAGTPAAAVAQKATVVLSGTYATDDTLLVTVGGKVWTATVGDTSSSTTYGQAEAASAVATILSATLADSVTVASVSTGTGTAAATFKTTIGLTAKTAGTPIGVSIAKGTVAGTATASMATAAASQSATDGAILFTANTTATGATAVAEQKQLTLSGSTAYVGSITVTIDGTSYTAAPSVASANAAGTSNGTLAADVARIINSVLGTGSATSSGTTTGAVVVASKTAGTPVPNINVVFNADGSNTLVAPTEAWASIVPNMALTAAATSASAISAPTGTTSYTVKATGVANVSGASTTALDVSGTAVKTSGGSTVAVAGSDSVHVSGAKGAVTVKTGKATTSMTGAVASDSGSTAGDAAGVYVTGGTTVSVTVAGDNAGAVKIGAASYEKAAVNSTGYPKSNGNVALTPTGDVTVSGIKTTTGTDGKVDADYNGGNVTVYMNGGTSATVKGGATVAITDVQTSGLTLASTDATATIGASTLATATLAGLSGNATIKSDAITTVNVSDTMTAVSVNVTNSGKAGANSGAITFNVSNLGGSSANVTLKDDTATSVNVGSAAASAYDKVESTAINAGSKSYIVLDTAKATSVAFSNDKSVALAASTLPVATTITATGSGALDLGTIGTLTTGAATVKTTAVDASAASGAVTVSLAATINGSDANNHALSFKGGSGNDVVTLTGAMTSGTNAAGSVVQNTIDLGAGNDTLLKNGGSIAAGSTVNGGDGVDTIAASLLSAGNSAQITGFEVLGLDLTSGSYDTDLLVGATSLALLAQGGTYTNVEQAQGLTVVTGASSTSTTTNTITFTASTVTGSADDYTVSFAQSAPTSTVSSYTTSDAGVVVLAGIETINVASGGTGFLNNFITITGANARNVNLTGAQNLDIDFSSAFGGSTAATSTNGLGVATIDGSAMTGKLTINTANVLEAYLTTTVKGGSNNDTITLSALGGKGVVDAGAGDDKIVSAAASSIQTGGAGKDTFDVTLAVAAATVSSTANTATGFVTTITDFAAGDVLDFIGGTNGTHTATSASIAKLTLTTEATLDDAIVSALNASPKATSTAKEVVWFYYGGNTYVTFDASDDTSTNGGMKNGDIVVKLTGTIDLTSATFDATNGSVTIPA
jgi:hypothetical protein